MRKNPSLTVSQIARQVPQKTRIKSKIVGIEKAYQGNTPKFLAGYTCYRFVTRNTENGHQYKIAIYSPTPNVTLETKLIIDDPNPLFIFRYEYALAKRGNAYIYRSNGNPPVQTNPKLVPGLSHHSYRVIQFLIKNTNKNGLTLKRK